MMPRSIQARSSAPSLRSKIALALPVLAIAALVGSPQIQAQATAGTANTGSKHNSNAPVDYAADRIEMQDKQNRVILTGNVDIRQEELRMQAARTVVDYTNGQSMQIQRATSSGNVVVTRPDEVATGDVGVYDFNKKIITMSGNAVIKRANGDNLHGGRLVVDLNTNVSTASGGRVSGTFAAPKQNSDTSAQPTGTAKK